jgi:hypothetical protein
MRHEKQTRTVCELLIDNVLEPETHCPYPRELAPSFTRSDLVGQGLGAQRKRSHRIDPLHIASGFVLVLVLGLGLQLGLALLEEFSRSLSCDRLTGT